MLSNCYFWALWRYFQLYRQWSRAGRPIDRVPCRLYRPSRLSPNKIGHWVAGWWHPEFSLVEDPQSFVPEKKRDLPWWLLWTAFLFRGRVKHGDQPSSY